MFKFDVIIIIIIVIIKKKLRDSKEKVDTEEKE